MRQALTFEKLHRDERHAVVDPVVEGLHDVGAPECGRRLGLSHEPTEGLLVLRDGRIDDLDRDGGVELEVIGGPDRSHAALAETPGQAELVRDDVARSQESESVMIGIG